MIRQKREHFIITVVALFIGSFLLRLALVSKGPYHVDGLELVQSSLHTLNHQRLFYMHGLGFPLTVVCGAGAILLAQMLNISDPVFALNLMNVVLGALIIPLFYILIRRIFDHRTALFSATLLSLSPIYLGNSVFGNTHMVSLFFFLCSVWVLWEALDKLSDRYLVLSGILFGLSFAARAQDGIIMIGPVVALFFLAPHSLDLGREALLSRIARRMTLFFLPIVLVGGIFYGPVLLARAGIVSSPWIVCSKYQYSLTNFFVGISPRHIKFAAKFFAINFSFPGIALVVLGMFFCRKKDWRLMVFLLLWAAVPFFAIASLNILMPRYFMLGLFPLYAFQAYFLTKLSKKGAIGMVAGFIIVIIAAGGPFLKIVPLLFKRHQSALFPEFAEWVAGNTEKNAIIIAVDEGRFIRYYGDRQTIFPPQDHIYAVSQAKLFEFKKTIDDYLDRSVPVYITHSGLFADNPNNQLFNFMKTYYLGRDIGERKVEDFHRGVIYDGTYINALYQIYKKPVE